MQIPLCKKKSFFWGGGYCVANVCPCAALYRPAVEVVMPQNGIYHEGLTALADAFSNNPNLR